MKMMFEDSIHGSLALVDMHKWSNVADDPFERISTRRSDYCSFYGKYNRTKIFNWVRLTGYNTLV